MNAYVSAAGWQRNPYLWIRYDNLCILHHVFINTLTGTYELDGDEAYQAVSWALEVFYNLFYTLLVTDYL